jgi:two-component sensor histidine kinase
VRLRYAASAGVAGLGLRLVQRIAVQLDAELAVDVDNGTRISMTIPLKG